jgi:hypothetical protein
VVPPPRRPRGWWQRRRQRRFAAPQPHATHRVRGHRAQLRPLAITDRVRRKVRPVGGRGTHPVLPPYPHWPAEHAMSRVGSHCVHLAGLVHDVVACGRLRRRDGSARGLVVGKPAGAVAVCVRHPLRRRQYINISRTLGSSSLALACRQATAIEPRGGGPPRTCRLWVMCCGAIAAQAAPRPRRELGRRRGSPSARRKRTRPVRSDGPPAHAGICDPAPDGWLG